MTSAFTRRSLLAAGASLALPTALQAQGTVFDTDVVIVGAGSAGLAAAHELQRRNLRFVMLEARERIGGRVFTDRSLGAPFDAGALYIHWSERNPWREIAQASGIEAVSDQILSRGTTLQRENGRPGEQRRESYWRHLSDLFDTDSGPVPDVSFIERIGAEQELRRGTMSMARMTLGEEPERVSALDYARLWSGADLVMREGYGTLVQTYGAGVPVRLSTPVRAIDWSGQGVVVETSAGRITSAAVIVTVPVNVLKAGSIRFTPDLPASTRDGLDGLEMGALSKIALRFEGDRFDLPPNSSLWDNLGERVGFNFDMWPYDRDIAVAYLGGDHARELTRDGDAAALDRVLERLTVVFGSRVRAAYRGGRVHAWMNDPLSLGCYSHARPGHAEARARLAQPVAERIYFAGEATAAGPDGSFGAAMTAGGAFLAGLAAAQAIALQRGH